MAFHLLLSGLVVDQQLSKKISLKHVARPHDDRQNNLKDDKASKDCLQIFLFELKNAQGKLLLEGPFLLVINAHDIFIQLKEVVIFKQNEHESVHK